MKSIKLSAKIGILIALSIFVASLAVGIISIRITSSQIKEMTMENLEVSEQGVMNTLEEWSSELQYSTLVLADKTRLSAALASENYETADSLTTEQKKLLDIDYLLTTDTRGIVVGGSAKGKNLSHSYAVKSALNGTAAGAYESSDFFDYSLVYAYPIKKDGTIVGTVVGTFSLSDQEFVDIIKNTYKVECTIFNGNVRSSTTLGANLVGTKLDNASITNKVLKNGGRYEGYNKINGEQYMTIYVPIKNFIKPVIYEENQLENQYNQRIKEYLSAFITIDNNKNLIMPELLLNYNPNFIYKELKKFRPYIETSVYNFIKEKKYKSYINKNFEWKLDFDRLFENTNQDT